MKYISVISKVCKKQTHSNRKYAYVTTWVNIYIATTFFQMFKDDFKKIVND